MGWDVFYPIRYVPVKNAEGIFQFEYATGRVKYNFSYLSAEEGVFRFIYSKALRYPFRYRNVNYDAAYVFSYKTKGVKYHFSYLVAEEGTFRFIYKSKALRYPFRYRIKEDATYGFSYKTKGVKYRFAYKRADSRGIYKFRYNCFGQIYHEKPLVSFIYPTHEADIKNTLIELLFPAHEADIRNTLIELLFPTHEADIRNMFIQLLFPVHELSRDINFPLLAAQQEKEARRYFSKLLLQPECKAGGAEAGIVLEELKNKGAVRDLEMVIERAIREMDRSREKTLCFETGIKCGISSGDAALETKIRNAGKDAGASALRRYDRERIAGKCAESLFSLYYDDLIIKDEYFLMQAYHSLKELLFHSERGLSASDSETVKLPDYTAERFGLADIIAQAGLYLNRNDIEDLGVLTDDLKLEKHGFEFVNDFDVAAFEKETRETGGIEEGSLLRTSIKEFLDDVAQVVLMRIFFKDAFRDELCCKVDKSGKPSDVFILHQYLEKAAKEAATYFPLFMMDKLRKNATAYAEILFADREPKASNLEQPGLTMERDSEKGVAVPNNLIQLWRIMLKDFLIECFAHRMDKDSANNIKEVEAEYPAQHLGKALLDIFAAEEEALSEPGQRGVYNEEGIFLSSELKDAFKDLADLTADKNLLLFYIEKSLLASYPVRELLLVVCVLGTKDTVDVDLQNERELSLWKRFWFLYANDSSFDNKILPALDFPYEDEPVEFMGFEDLMPENWQTVYPETFWLGIDHHPIREGRELGAKELPLAINIMVDIINILILMWCRFYPAFWGWTGTQAVIGITTEVYKWLTLETSVAEQDDKDSRRHYERCYRWLRWEAEKVSLMARNDMELRGNYYVGVLLEEMINYMLDHHFDVMPIFEDVNKMDEWRRSFDRDLQNDITWVLDKVKGLRHKLIVGKERKDNA